MAKVKSTTSGNSASGPRSERKASPSGDGRKPAAATKSAAPTQRGFSMVEIGHVAGDLWQLLDNTGAQSLAAIKKAIDAPGELTLAAIGWLAREDKLDFSVSGRSVKIALRQ